MTLPSSSIHGSRFDKRVAAWGDGPPGQQDALRKLRELLDEEGAIAADGRISLQCSSTHSAPYRGLVFLAEARALILRHPNPFPRIRLFRWLPK